MYWFPKEDFLLNNILQKYLYALGIPKLFLESYKLNFTFFTCSVSNSHDLCLDRKTPVPSACFLTYMTSWTTHFFSLTLDSTPHIYTEKLTSAKHYEKHSVDEATQEALDIPFAEVGNVCQFNPPKKSFFFFLSPSIVKKNLNQIFIYYNVLGNCIFKIFPRCMILGTAYEWTPTSKMV